MKDTELYKAAVEVTGNGEKVQQAYQVLKRYQGAEQKGIAAKWIALACLGLGVPSAIAQGMIPNPLDLLTQLQPAQVEPQSPIYRSPYQPQPYATPPESSYPIRSLDYRPPPSP